MPDPGGAQAAALTGRLAELGETRLVLLRPGHEARRLLPRETDLPAVLLGAMRDPPAVLVAETLGLQFEIDAAGIRPADERAAGIFSPGAGPTGSGSGAGSRGEPHGRS